MKRLLQFKKVFLMLTLLASSALLAQSSITGSVKDTNGDLIPGVNIILKGTTLGANTDFDGNYEIKNVSDGTYTIVASYIGYDSFSKSINVSSNTTLNIVLKENAQSLDEIIVTGVVNAKSKLESSVSISTIGAKLIEQSAPRSAGELFRNVPGIRAESSGGDGNANFSVRGVPVSSGGSRYLQLQEDGLPLMLFGDTSFGNSDNFLRIDSNIGRVEAIRGGSAATQTSNGPAGIINMISKNGAVEGGSIAATYGLDFNSSRLDFDYGTPLANGLSYHIGGFMRTGEGPRKIGYQGNKGGQFKANITKKFKKGYVRTYFKFLNDRSVMYMPMPMLLKGTDSDPEYANLPGFDITSDSPHSAYLQQNVGTSSDGNVSVNDVRNGNNPRSTAIGAEFSFDLGNDWKINGKGRYSMNNGEWIAPFTARVGSVADIEGAARDASKATGALVYSDGDRKAFVPANGLAQIIHMFDVTVDDLNNFFSDVKISKKVNDNIAVTAGLFSATQNTKTSWQWGSFISEVKGGGQARLADFDGYSRNGQFAYGVPIWECCQRTYNTVHNVNSPYVGIDADINDNLNFDGSVRFENVNVNGVIQAAPQREGNYDVNGDGVIQGIEQNVPVNFDNSGQTINDEYSFLSYSMGLNYKLNDDSAIFARYSKGASGRAADRNAYSNTGTASVQYDETTQTELGYKKRFSNGVLNATAFHSVTDEDAGSALNLTVGNKFRATGLEVESAFNFGDLVLNGSVTYTNSKIVEDNSSDTPGINNGNKPQRQADFVYNLSPTYSFGSTKAHLLGLSILGTTESYAFDNNTLIQPGYAYVNFIGKVSLAKGLFLVANINNMFDTVGITEVNGVDPDTYNGDRLVRARSISGRSSTLSLQYTF